MQTDQISSSNIFKVRFYVRRLTGIMIESKIILREGNEIEVRMQIYEAEDHCTWHHIEIVNGLDFRKRREVDMKDIMSQVIDQTISYKPSEWMMFYDNNSDEVIKNINDLTSPWIFFNNFITIDGHNYSAHTFQLYCELEGGILGDERLIVNPGGYDPERQQQRLKENPNSKIDKEMEEDMRQFHLQ